MELAALGVIYDPHRCNSTRYRITEMEKYNFLYFFMTPLRNGVGRIIEIRTIKMISDTIILNQQIFTKLKKYVIYD